MNLRMIVQIFKILFWLLVLFAGAWIGEQLNDDPGFMVLSLAGYRIEMTGWLAIATLFLSWILVYFIIKIFANFRLDRKLVSWQQNRSKQMSGNQLQQGLYQLARGNFKAAHKLFTKSATKSSTPTINYLLAAFAAHSEGKNIECDRWIIKAEEASGSDAVLTGLLQASIQVQRKESEQALSTLNRMQGQDLNPFRQELLRTVLLQLQDWQQLEPVIANIKKLNGKSAESVFQAEKELCLNQFSGLDVEQLNKKWKQLSSNLKQDIDVVLGYCRKLVALELYSQAEQVLQKAISQEFNAELVIEYGLLPADKEKQFVTAERWLREKPAEASLLVTLGRLSLKNKYWGKAQEYFNLAVDICDYPTAHAELARFYAAQHNYPKSIFHFEQCLITSHQLPEVPLPEPEAAAHV